MAHYNHLVLFDIGGVLLKLDYSAFYMSAAQLSGLTPEQFKNRYTSKNLEANIMTGSITTSEFFDGIRGIIGKDLSEQELKELFASCWKGKIEEVVDLKRRVYQAGYAVGMFSNISEFAVEILSAKYPEIFDTFDESFPKVYSCEVGFIKPHLPMYKKINRQRFDTATLIDDKPGYLRTGIENFGWNGILFTPYIDEAEAIRAKHTDTTKPTKNFKVANSFGELEYALRHFGVKI